jgi:hypothetical protein
MLNWFCFEFRHHWRKYQQRWLQLLLCSGLLALSLLTLALFSGAARFLQASIPAGLAPDRQYFTVAGSTQHGQPALFALAHADKIASSAVGPYVAFYQALTASIVVQGVEHQASRIALVSPNFFQLLQPPLLSGAAFNQHNHLQQAVVSSRFLQQLKSERTFQVHGQAFQVSGVIDPTFCAPDLTETCPDIWLSSQHQYLFLAASPLHLPKDHSESAQQQALLTRQAFGQIQPAFYAFGVLPATQHLTQIRQQLAELPLYSQNGQLTYQGKTVSSSAYAALSQTEVVSGLTISPASRQQQLQLIKLILAVASLMTVFALMSLFLLIAYQWQQHQAEFRLRLVLGMPGRSALRLLLAELSLLGLVLFGVVLLCWSPVSSYLAGLPVLGAIFHSYQQQLGWLDLVWLMALLLSSLLLLCLVLTLNIRRQLQLQQHQQQQNSALRFSLSLSLALLLTLAPAVILLQLDLARMQSAATVGSTNGIYSLAFTGSFDPNQPPDPAQRQPLFDSVGLETELALYLPLQGSNYQQSFRLAETAASPVSAFVNPVSAGFFALLKVELITGQWPQQADEVVLSATMAHQLALPPAQLLGKLLLAEPNSQRKIVGIVSDLHYSDPYGKADAVLYAAAEVSPGYLYQQVFRASEAQVGMLQKKLKQPAYADLVLRSQQQLNQKQHQNFQSLIEVLTFTAFMLSLVLLVIFYYGIQRLLAAKGKEPLLLLALGCPLWQLPVRQLAQLRWPILLALPLVALLLGQLPVSLNQLQQQSWLLLLLVGLLLVLLTLLAIAIPLLQQLRQPLTKLLGEQRR